MGEGYNPKSLANLKSPKPGEPGRNPKGTNRWQRAQATLSRFLDEVASANGDETRFQRILFAAYTSALVPGARGAADRKLLIEMKAGRAKQQIDVAGTGTALRVVAVLPDNGRGPDDPEPSDGENAEPSVCEP